MITQTKATQDQLTPEAALAMLVDGNSRFVENSNTSRELLKQVDQTSAGQFPFAVIHSCIDSRVPAELVFDQGIGDIFSTRVAGNIINEDVLGSIEYGCKVAGSKVVLILGHSKCGAVTAACRGVELGNITPLLEKIKPSVAKVQPAADEISSEEIERVAALNVQYSIDLIRSNSAILKKMEDEKSISIVGGIYDVATGKVDLI